MSRPIGKESGSQWFYEFHLKEGLLLATFCFSIWFCIILNAKFQLCITVLVHFTSLFNHILRWTTAEYGSIK